MTSENLTFATRMQAGVDDKKVATLRQCIQKDIDLKQRNNQNYFFRTYSKFSTCLPPLSIFPDEFRQLITEALVDVDMKEELQRARAINWCAGVKTLLPLKTTSEGNCLLHAVSQYMWGIEDDDLFLRRLLYVTMTTDPNGQFRKRWIFHQRTSPETEALGGRLDTQDIIMEWDAAIRATEDVARTGNGGLPYDCLESIHLYILANLLRRPIIVVADSLLRTPFGRSIQENTIGGIYLPLDCDKTLCDNNPIVIGYCMNHFTPLVGVENNRDSKKQVIPIVTHDISQLRVQYLLPNEEHCVNDLIPGYLSLTEVVQSESVVPAAKLSYNALPNDISIMNEYRHKCEQKYRRILDGVSGYHVNQTPETRPLNFEVENRANFAVAEPPSVAVSIQAEQVRNIVDPQIVVRKEPRKKHVRCVTVGCKMYGSRETSNLCSKCFKEFTVLFRRQEEEGRRQRQLVAVARHSPTHGGYTDLSMMGEDCKARCGFKCSTETYPYCHECYPLYGHTQAVPVPPAPQRTRPAVEMGQVPTDSSLMPDNCRAQNCRYKASSATFPYCHECFDQQMPEIPNATAPPVSVFPQPQSRPVDRSSSTEHNLQLNIRDDDETRLIILPPVVANQKPVVQTSTTADPTGANWNNLPTEQNKQQMEPIVARENIPGALLRQCETNDCENAAIRGNGGSCNECYERRFPPLPNEETSNLLGTLEISMTPRLCSTRGCPEELLPGTTHCTACFVQYGVFSNREPVQVPMETQMVTPNMNLNMLLNMSSESDKNIAISGSTVQSKSCRSPHQSLSRSFHGEPSQHDEMSHITSLAPKRETVSYPPSNVKTYRKHICAKAGCQGLRLNHPSGLCYACMQEPPPVVRNETGAEPERKSPSSLEATTPIVSYSPYVPTEREKQAMNPIVTSSKQKVKCAASICDTMIYPPRKLCDSCIEAVERKFAEKSLNEKLKQKSIGLCVTSGCKFHGAPQMNGYCSTCYKGARHRQETSGAVQTPRHHTAPLRYNSSRITEETRHTAPLLEKKHKYVAAQRCIELDCERYGDPSQAMRCSHHYKLAMSPIPPEVLQSGELATGIPVQTAHLQPNKRSAEQNRYADKKLPGLGRKESTGTGIPSEGIHIPKSDPFTVAYSKLETSRKSTDLCKNNTVNGCSMYGNSSNAGYCNACYREIREVQRQLKAKQFQGLFQGQNQIG